MIFKGYLFFSILLFDKIRIIPQLNFQQQSYEEISYSENNDIYF